MSVELQLYEMKLFLVELQPPTKESKKGVTILLYVFIVLGQT